MNTGLTIVLLLLLTLFIWGGIRFLGGRERQTQPRRPRVGLGQAFIYSLMILSVLMLALTGLALSTLVGKPMSGYPLMLHVGFGGLLIVCLVVLLMVWGDRCRLTVTGPGTPIRFRPAMRIPFWWIMALGLVSGVTAVIMMTPLPNMAWMLRLTEIHRVAGILILVPVVWHLIAFWRRDRV